MVCNDNTLLSMWVWNLVCPFRDPFPLSTLCLKIYRKRAEQALKRIKNNQQKLPSLSLFY